MSTSIETDRKRDALIERLVQSSTGMFDIYTTYLGDRLGLYQALAAAPGCTSTGLAQRTATLERYMREWLEQRSSICLGTTGCQESLTSTRVCSPTQPAPLPRPTHSRWA